MMSNNRRLTREDLDALRWMVRDEIEYALARWAPPPGGAPVDHDHFGDYAENEHSHDDAYLAIDHDDEDE